MKRNEMPMVSVAMVAYNQATLIERAIMGVVNQRTPFAIELIIVDDCSSDATHDVCLRMQNRFPDIVRVFRNPVNIGLQKNYLRAFEHCRGKYLAMCDADDYWCNRSKLLRQVEYMETHPECAITFHRVINHYAATGEKSLSNPHQSSNVGIKELSRGNFITNCSVVYRREAVNLSETSLPNWITDDVWPDYPLHMLFAATGSIHYFPQPMAVYRQGGSGAWTAAGEYGRQQKALAVRRHLLELFADRPEAVDGLRTATCNILIAMARCAPDEQTRLEAIKELSESFGLSNNEIRHQISHGTVRKPLSRRLLTLGRRMISRLVPLPKPAK